MMNNMYQQILDEIQNEKIYLDDEHVYEVYAKENDMTFIMRERPDDAPLLINYYFGEPDTQATFYYYNEYKDAQRNSTEDIEEEPATDFEGQEDNWWEEERANQDWLEFCEETGRDVYK